MRSILFSGAVIMVIAVLGAFDSVRAAALAFDSAADPAYGPYLQSYSLPSGVNGGYGWGSGWVGPAGPSTFEATVLSTSSFTFANPFTSPGYEWLLRYWSGIQSLPLGAERLFEGGLEPGQRFSVDFRSAGQAFYLLDLKGNEVYEIDTGLQANNYLFTYVGKPYTQRQIAVPFGVPYTDEGENFSITPLDANNAMLSITSYAPGGGTVSIEMPYSTVGGVYFEAEKEVNVAFNNLSITPEPASAALIAAAGLGLLLRRSRKNRLLNAPDSPL